MNIELPVFAIHGNHDYPQDECGNLSVLDLFHTTKYLNHFGKFTNNDKIKVILMKKIGKNLTLSRNYESEGMNNNLFNKVNLMFYYVVFIWFFFR